jgi:hypothetical protein
MNAGRMDGKVVEVRDALGGRAYRWDEGEVRERRPCWWTASAKVPFLAKDEATQTAEVNKRMELLLRRATIEYYFTVDQVSQLLTVVPPSGKEAVLLVLFNRIVDPENLKLDSLLPVKYSVSGGAGAEFVKGVDTGRLRPAPGPPAPEGSEHVALSEEMVGQEREQYVGCEPAQDGRPSRWLKKIDRERKVFLERQPIGASFKRRVGSMNLINPFLPDGKYEFLDLSDHEDHSICKVLLELALEQGPEYVDKKLRAWTYARSGRAQRNVSTMWADGVPRHKREERVTLEFNTMPRGPNVPQSAGANYEVRCRLARQLRMPGSGRWHAVPQKDAAPGQDPRSVDDDDHGQNLELGEDHQLHLRLFAKLAGWHAR